MSWEEGLSVRARAFSVENILKSSSKGKVGGHMALCSGGIRVQLCSSQLWKEFNNVGTEMLVTKAGRRMFPPLEVSFHGLSSNSTYIMYMDVIPVGNLRYRYTHQSSQWTSMESKELLSQTKSLYVHPESPASGQLWSSLNRVSFHEVKLTNNKNPLVRGQISLQSMHKYQPRILILEVPQNAHINSKDIKEYVLEHEQFAISFEFPLTSFITVTAYQNPEITRLKMWNNPFAHWPQVKDFDEQTKDQPIEREMKYQTGRGLYYKTAPVKIVYNSAELQLNQNPCTDSCCARLC